MIKNLVLLKKAIIADLNKQTKVLELKNCIPSHEKYQENINKKLLNFDNVFGS